MYTNAFVRVCRESGRRWTCEVVVVAVRRLLLLSEIKVASSGRFASRDVILKRTVSGFFFRRSRYFRTIESVGGGGGGGGGGGSDGLDVVPIRQSIGAA